MYKYFNVNSTLLQKAETSIFYCIFIRDWILFSKLVSISIFCYSFFSSFSLFQNMPSPIIILLSILQPTSKQILFFFLFVRWSSKRYPALSRIEVKNNESDNENTKKKKGGEISTERITDGRIKMVSRVHRTTRTEKECTNRLVLYYESSISFYRKKTTGKQQLELLILLETFSPPLTGIRNSRTFQFD